uniref:DNA-directed RNA polymerase subunit alpha n=1 Tax=Zygnema circumcarinatum TaxID=35869 RepID=A0A6N0GXG1_ZYGCR|nr:alpha subunit of RNA polymerase [Zygnema circumcarinatum]
MNLHRISNEPKCKCLNHEIQNLRLHYGRFVVYPLSIGQAITIGTAIRRALLGEVHSTCITSAYVVGATHEYSTLKGIRESIHDILLNLKDIVLKSDILETQKGIILFNGPGIVTAEDIQLPPTVKVVDSTQYIANIETSTSIEIHITIENTKTCTLQKKIPITNGIFVLDAALKPVRNINYSIHSLGERDIRQEMLVLEVWTNGSLTPQEAISEASQNLNSLLKPLLTVDNTFESKPTFHSTSNLNNTETQDLKIDQIGNSVVSENQFNHQALLPVNVDEWLPKFNVSNGSAHLSQQDLLEKFSYLEGISIDDLQVSVRASNCLKKVGIYTVRQLLNYTPEDLFKIKHLGKKSVEQIVIALNERYGYILK